MKIKGHMEKQTEPQEDTPRRPYEKPVLERVDLALAETLSAGCKLADECDDEFDPISEAGS